MPSTSNHSPGSPAVSSAGFPTGENPEYDAALSALIAQSERAADALAAAMHAGDYDAAMSALAAESELAAQRLLIHLHGGTVPAVLTTTGKPTT